MTQPKPQHPFFERDYGRRFITAEQFLWDAQGHVSRHDDEWNGDREDAYWILNDARMDVASIRAQEEGR